MLRKGLCAGMAALTLMTAFALPATVRAGEPVILVSEHRHCFKVLFRACHRDPWQLNGVTNDRRVAHDIARQLRKSGYQAKVVRG